MAEYLTRSSSGKNDSTASISVVLPAALALWMMMASGLSSLRDTPARYATSVLLSSPMMPAWWNASRKRPMRFGSRNHASAASRSSGVSVTAAATFSAGFAQFGLRLLDREQQARNVALEQVGGESGFLGGAFDEAAALRVAAQVHLIQVKAFTGAQAQRDFERVRAECLFQTGHAILAAFQFHEPRIARVAPTSATLPQCCWLFLFSRRLR